MHRWGLLAGKFHLRVSRSGTDLTKGGHQHPVPMWGRSYSQVLTGMCTPPDHLGSQQKIHGISLEISCPLFKFAWKDAWPQAVLHWDGMGEREGHLVHTQDLHLSLSWTLVALSTLTIPAISGLPGPFCFLLCCSPFWDYRAMCLLCSCPLSIFWKLVDIPYLSMTPLHIFLLSWVYYLYFILLLLLSWRIRGIFVFSI